MDSLNLVRLAGLMERTSGSSEVKIGLIDGPVVTNHPALARESLREIPGNKGSACSLPDSFACLHGTFVAGILNARRGSPAPAICPGCTLVIRPIFPETKSGQGQMPSATPQELAAAIMECIQAGARVINLSLALDELADHGEPALKDALNQVVRCGVILVAAAGNQGTAGSSGITRHPWIIPVVACDGSGRPVNDSNLGSSIGRRGLMAPGVGITSLGPGSQPLTLGGTSVAVPFVTGAIGLLWSEFPDATAAQIKLAVTQSPAARRTSVVPPLLDAGAAYRTLSFTMRGDSWHGKKEDRAPRSNRQEPTAHLPYASSRIYY